MGVDRESAIWIIEQEDDHDPNILPIFEVDIEDDAHAILVMMKLGISAEKKTFAHQLAPSGKAIFEALAELRDGRMREGKETAIYFKWCCWSPEFDRRVRESASLEDFTDIFFGQGGLIETEIDLAENIIGKSYHDLTRVQRDHAAKLMARWQSVEHARDALRFLSGEQLAQD